MRVSHRYQIFNKFTTGGFMKNKLVGLFIAGIILISGGFLMAQEKKPDEAVVKKEEKKPDEIAAKKDDNKALDVVKEIYRRLDIGVLLYMDWTAKWGQKDSGPGAPYGNATSDGAGTGGFDRVVHGGNGATLTSSPFTSGQDYQAKNNNGFNISRAYLNVIYRINDILTVRLTSDVDAGVSPSASLKDANPGFHLYLKYAYLEAKKDFGPVWISATGGMIDTPISGLIDKISDYRWIQQNYLNQANIVLNGQKLDTSADLGVKVSVGVMKYLTLTGACMNGSGYTGDEMNSYKSFYYIATANPLKEIYVNVFGRNEITTKYDFSGKKAKRDFYGYGVAYMSDIIKVGFNHIFPYVTTVGLDYGTNGLLGAAVAGNSIFIYPLQKRGYMLFDSWLNFNLGPIVPEAPIIVTGRFVYGLQRGTYQKAVTDPECGKSRTAFLYALGVGWAFNNNFRILLGGEIEQYFVRKSRVLSIAENRTSSPNWYNASGITGGTTVFVGSRNPHDTKRLYIKTEVKF